MRYSCAFSTFKIFPRKGKIAWKARFLPCFAVPPAESPSTKYISQVCGSESEQSANLPGNEFEPRTVFRWTISRALRAAWRACAAKITLATIWRASFGCSSNQDSNISDIADETAPETSPFPNFVFVWPSNWGSATFTEITAVNPSRKSSPAISIFNFSKAPDLSA